MRALGIGVYQQPGTTIYSVLPSRDSKRRFLPRLKRTSSVDISLARLQNNTHRPCGCIHHVRKLNYKCPVSVAAHCATETRGSTGPWFLEDRAEIWGSETRNLGLARALVFSRLTSEQRGQGFGPNSGLVISLYKFCLASDPTGPESRALSHNLSQLV